MGCGRGYCRLAPGALRLTLGRSTTQADVEIDEETGQVTVLKLTNCHDSGKALNPQNVKGQLIGGAIMGLGWVLSEDVPVEEGVILTPSPAEYLIPTAMDTPEESEALIIESPYPTGPYDADVGAIYHEWSKPRLLNLLGTVANRGRQPALYKEYAWAEQIPLPSPNDFGGCTQKTLSSGGAQCGTTPASP